MNNKWFEKKFGPSELIALFAVALSLWAIYQSHLARNDARIIAGLDLVPDIRLSSDFKRIKITDKPDLNEIKEKKPYFVVVNNGPKDAIQFEIQMFMHKYSPDTGKLEGGITASMYHWVIEKFPPLKKKVFKIDDWFYMQPTAISPMWHSVLEIRLSYRREPDLQKFTKRAFYFVGPQHFWVSESDYSTLNSERYIPIVKAAIGAKTWKARWLHDDILHDYEAE